MNRLARLLPATLAGLLAFSQAWAQSRVVIKSNRTNVRAKPSTDAEIIGTLGKGTEVVVLGEVKPPGSQESWSRIAMPPSIPVWVYQPLLNTRTSTVRTKELNYRAGPGRNYSVLGTLWQGDSVKIVRQLDDWAQIEPPNGAVAFVATRLLQAELEPASEPAAESAAKPATAAPSPTAATPTAQAPSEPATTPAVPPTRAATTPPPPLPPPQSTFTPTPIPALEQAPASRPPSPSIAATEESQAPAATTQDTPPAESVQESPTNASARLDSTTLPPDRGLKPGSPRYRSTRPGPRPTHVVKTGQPGPTDDVVDRLAQPRFVVREGVVRPTISIQAPTEYELRDGFYAEGNIDYLMPQAGSKLSAFSGKRVLVSGHEYRDSRWQTPVLKVEDIEILP